MPISVTCSCGKTLQVRDDLAGKAVKCPSCQAVLKVGSGSAVAAKTAAPQPAAPQPAAAKPGAAAAKPGAAKPAPAVAQAARPAAGVAAGSDGALDRLFEEEGFKLRTGKYCPACAELLQPGAVLCTKCGFHLEAGTKLQGHQLELEEEHGAEAALRRAANDMKRAKELDERLQGAGMPPWMMAMILYLLVSVAGVGVAAVNVANRSKENAASFNAVATILVLAGAACAAVASGASCIVLYKAFRQDVVQGLLVMFVPLYVFYYAFTNFSKVGKPFLASLFMSILCGVCFVLAGMSNSGAF